MEKERAKERASERTGEIKTARAKNERGTKGLKEKKQKRTKTHEKGGVNKKDRKKK